MLISIDSLRPDHLGCYGYARDTSPHIDRIAREGTLFECAISSTSWTLPAHASMFTGLADTVHGAVSTKTRLGEGRYTLAERLRDAGYLTAGFFSGPTLYPVFGLAQGFETYVDCTSYADLSAESAQTPGIDVGGPLQRAAMADITSPRIVGAVVAWLDERERKNTRPPFFLFIHMWDVHFDFIPPPPYDAMFDPDYAGHITGRNFIFDDRINAQMPQRDRDHIIALYDGEIAWTDMHVGRIVTQLEERGLLDNTLLLVTADHGTEFFEHGSKGHRQTLFDEVIRIPLIIRWPDRVAAAERIDTQVRMMDLLPTIMDLTDLGEPDDVMGQSLVPLLGGDPLPADNLAVSELYSLGRDLRTVRRADRKMLMSERDQAAIFYDLLADPGERAPIRDPQAAIVHALRQDAERALVWLDRFRSLFPVTTERPVLTEELRRQLESFGYIGGGDDSDDDE